MGKYFGGEALGTKRQICLMITIIVGDQARAQDLDNAARSQKFERRSDAHSPLLDRLPAQLFCCESVDSVEASFSSIVRELWD
jgi:hypothetical protein